MENNALKSMLKTSLIDFFEDKKKEWYHSSLTTALDDLLGMVTRGKLLRGSLFLASLGLNQEKFPSSYLDIAMALEITHTAFLVHDDIMDKSSYRRGNLTIHELWKERDLSHVNKNIDKTHYGYAQAICVGDIALFLAQQLLVKGSLALNRLGLINYAQTEWIQVCFGQMMDMQLGEDSFQSSVSDEQILEVYRTKTAQYTFSLPIVMAAQCLDVPDDIVSLLFSIGQNLGTLFQIQDDYLDIFGDPLVVKKSLGQDIREKKKTIYLCKLYRLLGPEDKKVFIGLSGAEHTLNTLEIQWLQQKMKDMQVLEDVDHLAMQYQQNVLQQLELIYNYPHLVEIIHTILGNSQTRKS